MTRHFLRDLLTSIAERGRDILDLPAPSERDAAALPGLCAQLLSGKGEATGTALAQAVGQAWEALDAAGRLAFFRMLAHDYAPDGDRVAEAARAYLAAPEADTLGTLGRVVEPPRQELFRRINMAPGGTATVVAMRAALLALLKDHPDLRPVDDDLRHLLTSWFNRGFLDLRRIGWDTPASILEKLIAYEAVHEIKGWDDLRRRLAPDRRCFAFIHPAMPGEPLIFVQVALVNTLADDVGAILSDPVDDQAPSTATTAIFYSISNCQRGLRGISFGNFLIKQVVTELSQECPSLETFATLSPIPGFRRWLAEQEDAEARQLDAAVAVAGWHQDPARTEALRPPLMRAAAQYLTRARRGDMPRDPVARFHLGNGARIEQLNWLADTSEKGLRESAGLMVNYAYRPSDIERNHEALFSDGRIAAARRITSLAQG